MQFFPEKFAFREVHLAIPCLEAAISNFEFWKSRVSLEEQSEILGEQSEFSVFSILFPGD